MSVLVKAVTTWVSSSSIHRSEGGTHTGTCGQGLEGALTTRISHRAAACNLPCPFRMLCASWPRTWYAHGVMCASSY